MNGTVDLPANAVIDDEGIWCQVLDRRLVGAARPALFLDRDGVVVEEVHYLRDPDKVRLLDGAVALIAAANRLEVAAVIVTNQSGIGRGMFGWAEFAQVQERIVAELAHEGARLDAVYACPHHPEGLPPFRHADHPARKPNPGMLRRAEAALGLDLGRSWIVGDKAADMAAGRNAGIAGGVHVEIGYGAVPAEQAAALSVAQPKYPVRAAPTVAQVLAAIPLLATSDPGGR